jgi:hypothetical protein
LRTKRLASWHSSWGHEPIFFLTNSKTCRLPLLQKVIRQDPKFADAIYQLGKIQLEQGETKAAILNLETMPSSIREAIICITSYHWPINAT